MIPKKYKKSILFISLIIILSGLGYVGYNLKRNPYPVSEFQGLSMRWGNTNGKQNSFDSQKGLYQFYDSRDSLFELPLKWKNNEIIYVHNKLFDMGFWNLPEELGRADSSQHQFFVDIQLKYKNKQKALKFYSDYEAKGGELDSAQAINQMLQKVLQESIERYVPENK